MRWDKNFLKIIRLLLERRARFALFGGVRFGGTLDADGAFALGFDHVAARCGRGQADGARHCRTASPTGVRTASDFLMALQLTGAAKTDSVANMQVRLPVVVVGGGLTAIDTATESLAYYPRAGREVPAALRGPGRRKGSRGHRVRVDPPERAHRAGVSEHARAIRAEREAAGPARPRTANRRAAAAVGRRHDCVPARGCIDSPSYTLNHEEVEKALEEGIRFAEGLTPARRSKSMRTATRARSRSRSITTTAMASGTNSRASASGADDSRGCGTQPNTVLAREDAQHFELDGKYFRLLDEDGQPVTPVSGLAKPSSPRC